MITLRNKLYESLLDDEEELVNNNDRFSDNIYNFLKNSKSLANNLDMPSCYIDNQLSKGGIVKLCACPTDKHDIPTKMDSKHNYLDEIPPNVIKKEIKFGKYFDGSINIWGSINDWPDFLSIAPIFSTTVYSKEIINQKTIPEYSLLFNSRRLSVLSGLTINCRHFTANYDKTPQQMITVNIKGNPKKISALSFMGDDLKEWDQLKNIQSNTENIILYNTTLAKNIINQYKVNLNKDNNFCLYNLTPQFKDFLKNFQNLNSITLDIKYSLYKNRNNNWELWYNYI